MGILSAEVALAIQQDFPFIPVILLVVMAEARTTLLFPTHLSVHDATWNVLLCPLATVNLAVQGCTDPRLFPKPGMTSKKANELFIFENDSFL